jgi:hypothetical protein
LSILWQGEADILAAETVSSERNRHSAANIWQTTVKTTVRAASSVSMLLLSNHRSRKPKLPDGASPLMLASRRDWKSLSHQKPKDVIIETSQKFR